MLRLLVSVAAAAMLPAIALAQDEEATPDALDAPSWQFWAEASALIMQRDFTDDFPVASSVAGGGPGTGDVFDSDDFEPEDWEPGVEGGLGISNGRWGIEGRGFWLDTFEESATVNGPIAGLTIDTNPPTGYGLPAGDTLTGTFTSDIHGAEAGVSFAPMPNATVYVGPRWIQLDEEFELFGDFGGGVFERDTWDVENQMLGGQVGFRTDWIALVSGGPRAFSLNTDASVGVFNNSADVDFNAVLIDFPFSAAADSEDLLAVAVDASLIAGYHFTPNIEFFTGYNVLWINGVATAVEQVAATGSYNGATPDLNIREGDALYHGGKAGLKVRF